MIYNHIDRTLKINFWIYLVCRMVMKVQRSSIAFTYMGASHVQKNQKFFLLFNFISVSHEFIVFLSCHFIFFVLLLFLLPCFMGRPKNYMLNVNIIFLLHGDFFKVSVFSLRLIPIRGLHEQFLCQECVSVSSVGFLVLGDKPIKEVYH